MRRIRLVSLAFVVGTMVACSPHLGSHPPAVRASSTPAAAAPPSPACAHAAGVRAEASKLDLEGHSSRARAKLDAANAECPSDRAVSADLELRVLVSLGLCAEARALAASGSATLDACKTIEAGSRGDLGSQRRALHAAYDAERTGDFAKAKNLYLSAWSELHPNPRAIESAARMAAAAGDAVEGRRLRDRALTEAETTEHATARLSLGYHLDSRTIAVSGRSALLYDQSHIGTLDLATGEYRLLVVGDFERWNVEPTAMLAVAVDHRDRSQVVIDLLTGERLAHVNAFDGVLSPDGSTLAASESDEQLATGLVRLYDPVTGATKAAAIGLKDVDLKGFVMGSSILAYYNPLALTGRPEGTYLFDVARRTGVPFAGKVDAQHWAYSANGAYFASLDLAADHLRVRDVTANKELVDLTGHFYTVDALAISGDGKTLVTTSDSGDKSSVRVYDVAAKKWSFTRAPGSDAVRFTADEKAVLFDSGGVVEWEVGTGVEHRRSSSARGVNVRRVVKSADGTFAFLSGSEVTVVKSGAAPRTVCRSAGSAGAWVEPTGIAFSSSGKSFVCSTSDGQLHVFETTGWNEQAVMKGAPTPTIEGDLAFSGDDAALLVASGAALVEIDVATRKERKRVAIRHPNSVPLAQRHARFSDGTLLVQKWSGGGSRFDANGTWLGDVPLVTGVQYGTNPQAFARDGATYAAAIDKAVHLVDLKTGTESVVSAASPVKDLALSADGKTALAALADGTVVRIAGGTSTVLREHAQPRVAFLGNVPLVWLTEATFVVLGTTPTELTVFDGGFLAQNEGGFETRGNSDAVCEVGHVLLSRETCGDRAREGVFAALAAP